MLNEFKQFILKSNVVDLSTGVIIGAAFGKIVDAVTKGIVDPILKFASGGKDPNVTLPLGIFDLGIIINAVVAFLITAIVIFFFIVKPANQFMSMLIKQKAEGSRPQPAADIALLTEIRDLLKK